MVGEASSTVPLAINIKLADVNTSTLNEDGSVTSVRNDFQFPQEVNIFAAGTLGDHVSYFAETTFGENPDGSVAVELEHARGRQGAALDLSLFTAFEMILAL